MKIIVTGSLGNIGKPLTELLVRQQQHVTVISSSEQRRLQIEALGASAAIGSIADVNFLINTFTGAGAVYVMIPLSYSTPDLGVYMRQMAENYRQALQQAGIKRIVLLSGWAANLIEGENIEEVFANIQGAFITILRPASFYTNFYQSMDLIRGKGIIGKLMTLRYRGLGPLLSAQRGLLIGNCGGDDKIVFVSPLDIAEAAAEELLLSPGNTKTTTTNTTVRYVGSEEMTCNEAARVIGTAIGKPWLKWVLISDKQMLQMLKMAKLPQKLAETLVQMQSAMHSGQPLENFHQNQPKMGRIKLADFAKEFAAVYNKK